MVLLFIENYTDINPFICFLVLHCVVGYLYMYFLLLLLGELLYFAAGGDSVSFALLMMLINSATDDIECIN